MLRVLSRTRNVNVVDGLNFIESLHTTTRSLEICSEIIRAIGNDQIPFEILEKQLIKWSNEIELSYEEYKNQKGILTKNNRPTTAFIHYIDFLNSINLITRVNDNCRSTKHGLLLNLILKEKNEMSYRLTNLEILFYLLFLFRIDSDGLLTTLELTMDSFSSQKKILEKFQNVFTARLETKYKYSNDFEKIKIAEKLRNMSIKWTNIQKYSEHIIPPRLEWLSSLKLINIKRHGNATIYSVSEKGVDFYLNLPIMENLTRDINVFWYNNNAVAAFSNIIGEIKLENWNKLEDSIKTKLFSIVLLKAFDLFGKDGAMRMSLDISILFIILELVKNYSTIIEVEEVEKMISPAFTVGKYIFSLHKAARETESYISIKIVR